MVFQSRILLLEPNFVPPDNDQLGQDSAKQTLTSQYSEVIPDLGTSSMEGSETQTLTLQDTKAFHHLQDPDGLKANDFIDETEYKEMKFHTVDSSSCLATCTAGDMEDDPFKSSYSYEAHEGRDDESVLSPLALELGGSGLLSSSMDPQSMDERLICGHWVASLQSFLLSSLSSLELRILTSLAGSSLSWVM